MKTFNSTHKIVVYRKPISSEFVKLNRQYITDTKSRIGASMTRNGINRGVTFEEEDDYLPHVLRIANTVPNWQQLKDDYWNGITKDVPETGHDLEIGFRYNLEKASKYEFAREFIAENKITTAEQLANLVELETTKLDASYNGIGKVKESQKYMFGDPIIYEDYLLWRYLLGYKHCAREESLVNKAEHIRFFLKDDKAIKLEEASRFKVLLEARSLFSKVIANETLMKDILVIKSIYNRDFTIEDCQMALDKLVTANPSEFVKLANDKDITLRSNIQRMISFGILRQNDNSATIYDAGDGITVGLNIDEAVKWFKDPAVAARANKLRSTLKATMKDNYRSDIEPKTPEVTAPETK